MTRYLLMSYRVDENAPLYPGTPPIEFKEVKAIKEGDSCNTFIARVSNHAGTHIDAPKHFFESGHAISRYPFKDLIFNDPVIIDCPKGKDEPIDAEGLLNCGPGKSPDILLIRTGFSKYRKNDMEVYSKENPYLLPQSAEYIRNKYPSVKAIGIDGISISSHKHKDIGKQAHRVLLDDGKDGSAVLIIEDMYIPNNLTKLSELIVVPFLGGGLDSSPCAVIGAIYD